LDKFQRYYSFDKQDVLLAQKHQIPRPRIFEYHPAPYCQLVCPYCHSEWGQEEGKLSKGAPINNDPILTLNEYKSVLKNFIKLGGEKLIISGGKEPFLHPEIINMIEISGKHGLKPHIYSNGISRHFNEKNAEKWIRWISSLRISLHESAGIEIIERIISNVEQIIKIRKNESTLINVGIIVESFSYHDLERVLSRIASTQVDGIELRPLLHRSNTNCTNKKCDKLLSDAALKLKKFGFKQDNIFLRRRNNNVASSHCFTAYRNIVMNPLGELFVCCMRTHLGNDDISYIGSIRDNTLSNLYVIAKEVMDKLNTRNCWLCSSRDSEFNHFILDELL